MLLGLTACNSINKDSLKASYVSATKFKKYSCEQLITLKSEILPELKQKFSKLHKKSRTDLEILEYKNLKGEFKAVSKVLENKKCYNGKDNDFGYEIIKIEKEEPKNKDISNDKSNSEVPKDGYIINNIINNYINSEKKEK